MAANARDVNGFRLRSSYLALPARPPDLRPVGRVQAAGPLARARPHPEADARHRPQHSGRAWRRELRDDAASARLLGPCEGGRARPGVRASHAMNDFAHLPHTARLGDLHVRRIGFGAMQIPGPMVWGEPRDPERARAVLCRCVELGIQLIDTSWYYGPHVANRLIAEVLHPYPKDLVIATKLGGMRRPDKSWGPALRPEELRRGCDEDLRGLRLERIDVVHLRWIEGAGVPFDEALDAMIALRDEGKVRHLALSNVTMRQVSDA